MASFTLFDAIWTWYNDPRAVYDPSTNTTIVGGVSATGHIILGRYHHRTGRLTRTDLGLESNDDHNNPGILVLDSAGAKPRQTLIGFSNHVGTAHSQYSLTVGASAMSNKTVIDSNATYAVLFQCGDTSRTLYWLYRDSTFAMVSATGWSHGFKTSTDGGATWSATTTFFQQTNERPYFVYPYLSVSGGVTRVDFACNQAVTGDANASPVSSYHFYALIAADGTRNWYKSDGAQIGTGDSALPLTTAAVTLVAAADASPVRDTLVWDVCNVGGTLSILYAKAGSVGWDTGTDTYWRATYSGGAWTSEQICDSGAFRLGGVFTYDGGLCFDPNDANSVYVSRAYAAEDFRIEKWTKSGGVWAKAIDVTGASGNGKINARPTWCKNSPTTQIFYWSATGYTSSFTVATSDVLAYPDLPVNTYTVGGRQKPAVPAWQAARAPLGVNGFWGLTEGTGTTAADSYTTPHNGSFVGSPTWGTGNFGPELSAFSTTKYIAINPASPLVGDGTYPSWLAVLVKNTTATDSYPISAGSSSSNTPIYSIETNASSSFAQGFLRDDSGSPGTAVGGGTTSGVLNDGNYHVVMQVSWAANRHGIYFDGQLLTFALSTATLGTFTLNRMALGVLLRAATASPYTGTIVAAASGKGAAPDPADFADDWLSGDFLAIRAPGGSSPVPLLSAFGFGSGF